MPTIFASAPPQFAAANARQIQTKAPPPALPPSRSTAAEIPPPARGTPRTPSNALLPPRALAHPRAHPNNSPATSKFSRNSSWSYLFPFPRRFRRRPRDQQRQLHSQRLVRPEQQRLQRALRTSQNFSNLRVFHFLILVQNHRRALLFRQSQNRAAYHLVALLLD